MQVIAIANQKGGCGKTTTAINLASTLSLNGARVLLIDFDPQAHATLGLGIESSDSIYNVISTLTPRKLGLKNIIKRVENSFDLAPSNILVGTLEQELADEIGRELKLTKILQDFKDDYDYVLIDCPPSLGFLSINALRASSEIIITVEASRFSLQGVERLMDITQLIKDRLGHNVVCKILITMFDSRLQHSFVVLDKIKEKYSEKLFNTIIHVNVKLKEAAFAGESVTVFDKYSRGFKDYFSLSKEIIKESSDDSLKRTFSSEMRQTVRQKTKELLRTTFSLDAPEAQSVYITGTFNDWSLEESCRMKKENGEWLVNVPLKTGMHRYRFIVDGRWREDPNNSQQERNPFGEIDSVVDVR